MNKIDLAADIFQEGFNCSQAVLSVYCEEYGLDKGTALSLSRGFGAGMGRMGKTCGAVTGAYMVLGLVCAKNSENETDAKEKTYALIQDFDKEFTERNTSTNCRELLGFDLRMNTSPEAIERVKLICPKMVRDAAEILENILAHA